jgi:hypothetical protein
MFANIHEMSWWQVILQINPQVSMKVTFIPQLFTRKTLYLVFFLHIGPYPYLRAYMIISKAHTLHLETYSAWKFTNTPLAAIAIFHFTLFTFKDLHLIEITNTPLILCTIHTYPNKHTLFTLNLMSNFLITWLSQPSPLKRISSRDSVAENNWTIRFGDWLEGSFGNFVEDRIPFPK